MSLDSAPVAVSVPPANAVSEQHLLRESERISLLLRKRRKATSYILVLFIAATLGAAVLLYQLVRQQNAKISTLVMQVERVGLAVREQEEWVRSFEARGARADSLLDRHDQLMAQSEGRSRAAADSLITDSLRGVHAQLMERTRDVSDLRTELGARDPNVRRDLSRLDTRVNSVERRVTGLVQTADLRPLLQQSNTRLNRLADSIDLLNRRVDRAHERYEYLNGRIDRLNLRIGANPGDRATLQRGSDSSRVRP